MTSRMTPNRVRRDSGFSLVELLVVVGIMGLIAASVQTLYVTHQRSATTEAEVVDVQQGLRVGMDQIGRDLEMAGFLAVAPIIPNGDPIAAAVDGGAGPDTITLNTASESVVAATIAAPVPVFAALNAGDLLTFTVTSAGGSMGGFEAADVGTARVRIFNYQTWVLGDLTTGLGARFTVNGLNAPCGVGLLPPCQIQLMADGPGAGAFQTINPGDAIVKTGTVAGGEGFPNTVQYSVAACPAPIPGQCLLRGTFPALPAPAVNPSIVATNVTNLQFRYLLDDGTEINAPVPDLSFVRAVRVTINGQTVATLAASGGVAKQRGVMSVVALRNRGVS